MEDSEIKTIIRLEKYESPSEPVVPRAEESEQKDANHLHPCLNDASRQRRKSPVTVQEWVAALPIPHTVQRGLALETQQQQERKDNSNSLGAPSYISVMPSYHQQGITKERDAHETINDEEDDEEDDEEEEEDEDEVRVEKVVHRTSDVRISDRVKRKLKTVPEGTDNELIDNLILGAEANSSGQEDEEQEKAENHRERKFKSSLDSKRHYLKESHEIYRSFQSDISVGTVSSVDSVLLSREINPTEMLMELGFGGPPTSTLARIPTRFLRDSSAKGISLKKFLSKQEEIIDYGQDHQPRVVQDEIVAQRPTTSEIVDNFIEHITNPGSRRSWMIKSWPSCGSLGRIPSSYTTNSVISSSQTSSISVKPPPSLKGVQAFRAAAHSVLSPANRLFLSEKPKPERARRIIIGDETLTVNEDGDIRTDSVKTRERSSSVNSAESDWSGEEEELMEMKRVAASSAEKNKAILRWRKIRKEAVKRQKNCVSRRDEEDAKLIFPLDKDDMESDAIREENERAPSLCHSEEKGQRFFKDSPNISHRQRHSVGIFHRHKWSTVSGHQNLICPKQRDHRIPKRFSFHSSSPIFK